MLMPKKVKHRKWHKGRRRGIGVSSSRLTLAYGSVGLKAFGHAWITSRQIEAARRVLTRYTKRGGKIWIRIFPDKPITTKGSEMPMGIGKGSVDNYVAVVKPGVIIFEMDGLPVAILREAMDAASFKLSLKTKIVVSE